jgi:hypothetical protein
VRVAIYQARKNMTMPMIPSQLYATSRKRASHRLEVGGCASSMGTTFNDSCSCLDVADSFARDHRIYVSRIATVKHQRILYQLDHDECLLQMAPLQSR